LLKELELSIKRNVILMELLSQENNSERELDLIKRFGNLKLKCGESNSLAR